jgi:hypothetical protein
MNKLILLLFCFYTLGSQAQTPHNDSCAVSVQFGSEHYWYCDGGILKTVLNSDVVGKSEHAKWKSVKESLKAHDQKDSFSKIKGSHTIPNDSCSMGFTIGSKKYLCCDSGYYVSGEKNYSQISSKEWNKQISSLPQSEDIVDSENPAVSGSKVKKERPLNKSKLRRPKSSQKASRE